MGMYGYNGNLNKDKCVDEDACESELMEYMQVVNNFPQIGKILAVYNIIAENTILGKTKHFWNKKEKELVIDRMQ